MDLNLIRQVPNLAPDAPAPSRGPETAGATVAAAPAPVPSGGTAAPVDTVSVSSAAVRAETPRPVERTDADAPAGDERPPAPETPREAAPVGERVDIRA